MKHLLKMCSLIICLAVLTGCVSREEADAKLGKACKAAAGLLLTDGFTVKSVNNVDAGTTAEFGGGYRKITVSVTESDSWLDVDKDYKCVFAEEFGIFNSSFDADLFQIDVDGQVFGMKDGQILGGPEMQIKLDRAVKSVLYD